MNRTGFPKSKSRDGWYSRGYLPHFDGAEITQAVCYRLFDSLPQEALERWEKELEHLSREDFNEEQRKRVDAYLDQGYGSCYLRQDEIARIVQENLLHFDGQRYRLQAWVVMPNHVHVLFTPLPGWSLDRILHSWKSYTANKGNELLHREGRFWQADFFDRYIRNARHYASALAYIENNPVKAGLCARPEEWRWSSAFYRSAGCQPASE
ncbi:MAG TPA: transposase [Blastocatellia bacterium]|nr:transposase [Blastocatellia bacterium]